MTWTKLDDGIFDHPKMVKAGEDAANLYVRALVYCNRFLTDGRIDPEVLSVITRKRDAAKLAEALVRVGAWEALPDGGWLVHGFHEHNPTSEQVAARRAEISEKRSKAGKIGGKRSGEARSNEANAKQTRSNATKQTEANAVEATKQNASPVPARPVPTADQSTPNGVLPQQQPSAAVAAVADASAKVEPSKPEKAAKGKVDGPAPQPGTPAAHIADAIRRAGSLRGLVKRPHSLAEAAAAAYHPALDVAGEIAKANGWCISNPVTAPKSDGDRFLWGWLTRAHAKVTEIAARDGQRGTLGQHASASARRPGAAPVAPEYAPIDNPEVLEVHELERRKAAARTHR